MKNINVIEHPNHYNDSNAMECIKEMELVFGKDAVATFCLLNVWKYRYRALNKNGQADLDKAHYYMKIYKELCDE